MAMKDKMNEIKTKMHALVKTRAVKRLAMLLGVFSFIYIFFAKSMTMVAMGIDKDSQLVAVRILTPLVFIGLVALAIFAESYWCRRSAALANRKSVLVLRFLLLIIIPLLVWFCAEFTPLWSFQSPSGWNRPRFNYGWPICWKGDKMSGVHMAIPLLNFILWSLYFMFLLGYRKLKGYIMWAIVMGVVVVLYHRYIGFDVAYRYDPRQAETENGMLN